ncbi:hypothetical protein E4U30_007430 [Claviceps sp. LM220 group G6]|nr:hypothetical protein E4U15_007003 [Claviceps sp. LM218 group G6]KAG6091044.1 hypothetical protein E4U31_007448 [Claviceps sp. LM219 group G6]KAG6091183.1 hypothetical protein E4U30_007430 [Claviceps sp. LM220 group G6]
MALAELFLSVYFVFVGLAPKPAIAHGSQAVVSDAITTRVAVSTDICEARTINYITHALPHSCLTTSWELPAPTSITATNTASKGANGSIFIEDELVSDAIKISADLNTTRVAPTDTTARTFMSFEDWKEMMLRRAGQDPQDLRTRQASDHHARDRDSADIGHAGFGEEGEISLDFEHYGEGEESSVSTTEEQNKDQVEDQVADPNLVREDGKSATVHLSKDAGKTCKERFSYSSFDAGATILKTSPGAKNAKAILVENKDTYMLLECDTSSKYVIIELSDDISVDTVVLANFEFFSSMVRHFRVSVSDRYPVKIDKWRDLGTFEALNSRDIQPFLVENPQIWAKYVRIEFLTHFGTEYYCPISLVRIHGSRMLDSWKDSESNREDDLIVAEDETGSPAIADNESQGLEPAPALNGQHVARGQNVTVWRVRFELIAAIAFNMTCPVHPEAGNPLGRLADRPTVDEAVSSDYDSEPSITETLSLGVASTKSVPQPRKLAEASPGTINAKITNAQAASQIRNKTISRSGASPDDTVRSNDSTVANERLHNATATPTKVAMLGGQAMKNRSSGTTGPSSASPTMQEGFFNAITKRLQHVESNLTLSMKYVEDQSKHMQEALQSREQKQQIHFALFLNDLNRTVLAELYTLREQYDQIWQSTVLALESQRHRSESDVMALSTRLNLLAEEVVFQKRMAIVQAIVLLSCLFLIIFSRGASFPSLGPQIDQSSAPAYSHSSLPQTTSRQSAYQLSKDRDHPENCHTSISLALHGDDQARADSDTCFSPSSVRFQADGATPVARDFNSSFYLHLPSHLGSSPLTDPDTPNKDGTKSKHANPRKLLAVLPNDVRKSLPSLPEHSPSHDSAE